VHATALAFVQAVMQDLAAGETDRVVAATRLRSEELAVAYQRQPAEEIERWRRHLQKLHAAGALKFKALVPEGLVLRRLAGGRLLDCLGADGLPVLSTEPGAQQLSHGLPLRITVLEGKVYVLR
jgi:hypothetical protein